MWISDLFMKRVEAQEKWSLMCPHECPGLSDTYGDEFEALYTKYEKEGKYRRIVPAQKLWFAILEAQTETGTPYMLYKDACNRKSNQKVCLSLNPLLPPTHPIRSLGGCPTSICHFFNPSICLSCTISQEPYII